MNSLTLTRDLWQAAERQIDKIKPAKIMTLKNQTKQTNRSMQSVFRDARNTISTLVPKALIATQVTTQNVPQSVKLLDLYAQKVGYLPMGSIYQKTGSRYIGRMQQITEKGERFYRQFPKTQSMFLDTPNLSQNFSFKANKAIQKWNQFVSAESQLANFLDRAKTEEGRRKMILQFAKGSSKFSNYYKILSSLYFMYVQQKSSSFNPLNLDQQSVNNIKVSLKTEGKLEQKYKQVIGFIQNSSTKNSFLVEKIQNFHLYKLASLKASLKDDQYTQIQPLINEKMATIPPQMISTPQIKDTTWFQILKKHSFSESLKGSYMTDMWKPNQNWFKSVNYLK